MFQLQSLFLTQYHHAYLKVFATEGLGFEKWVLLLGLLTNITTNMFLLALVSARNFNFHDVKFSALI